MASKGSQYSQDSFIFSNISRLSLANHNRARCLSSANTGTGAPFPIQLTERTLLLVRNGILLLSPHYEKLLDSLIENEPSHRQIRLQGRIAKLDLRDGVWRQLGDDDLAGRGAAALGGGFEHAALFPDVALGAG